MKRCSLLLLLAVGLSGCTLGRSPETSFFMLPSPANTISPPAQHLISGPRIAIGPVSVPSLLDHSRLFIGTGNTAQVELTEFKQWSEPVGDGITRVLSQTLTTQLAPRHGMAFPLRAALAPQWRISVNVSRLDGAPNDIATLEAGWTLSDETGKELRSGIFSEQRPAGADIPALVQAQGALVEALGLSIAKQLPL